MKGAHNVYPLFVERGQLVSNLGHSKGRVRKGKVNCCSFGPLFERLAYLGNNQLVKRRRGTKIRGICI